MRFVFILPDLVTGTKRKILEQVQRRPRLSNVPLVRRVLEHPLLYTHVAWGGTLNLMRHAEVARRLGADVALATPTGRDTYGDTWGLYDLPYIKLADRRPDDVVIVPDYASDLADAMQGPVIVYLQVPIHLYANFDYMADKVTLWTDSPFMLDKCQKVFPGKDIPIVPNVVDCEMFPFVEQRKRSEGVIFAFPRKGPDYIAETRRLYEAAGGKYWHFELIDGIPVKELAREYTRPQAFLASADIEGCALPPQESMAAGVIVIGKNARGANFAMEHGRTALIADTPEEAAACLREAEDAALRESIAANAHEAISRYFPDRDPSEFWRANIDKYAG